MYCKFFFGTCETSLSSSRSTSGNSGAAEASCKSARDRAAARHAVDARAARLLPRLLAPQPGESVQAAAVSAHQRPAQQPGAHPSHESAGRTDSDRTSHTPQDTRSVDGSPHGRATQANVVNTTTPDSVTVISKVLTNYLF